MVCKLFSHRGFLNNPNLKENTIKSFQNAINHHFKALECDIWFIKGQFILNHDQPEENTQKYDKLEQLFEHFGNKIDYWLDFKNLNQQNITAAIKNLKEIIDKFAINYEKIYFIPYLDNINLDKNLFAYQEIRENFGQNCQLGAFLTKIDKNQLENYREKLDEHKINILSIYFKNIDENFVKTFQNIQLFAWTVNEKADFNYLKTLKIENIATDKILP